MIIGNSLPSGGRQRLLNKREQLQNMGEFQTDKESASCWKAQNATCRITVTYSTCVEPQSQNRMQVIQQSPITQLVKIFSGNTLNRKTNQLLIIPAQSTYFTWVSAIDLTLLFSLLQAETKLKTTKISARLQKGKQFQSVKLGIYTLEPTINIQNQN